MTGAAARAAITVVLALAVQAHAQEPVPAYAEFADLPGVSFVFYDVEGGDEAAVRASMNAKRPSDINDGRPVDALTRWRVRWTLRSGAQGCALAGPLQFSAVITLPRLASGSRSDAKLVARWDEYMAALRRHEAGHVRHAYEHLEDVRVALSRPGEDCARVTEAAKGVIAVLAAYDGQYDRETRHGFSQGARFP